MKRIQVIIMVFFAALSLHAQDSLRNQGYPPYVDETTTTPWVTVRMSQFDTLNRKKIIGFCPQYLAKYGIRIEMERKLSPNKWLVIAPALYFSEKQDRPDEYSYDNNSFSLLAGLALSPSLKIFARPNGDFGGYINVGPTYHYYYMQYYESGETDDVVEANIQKVGFDVTLGYQFLIKDLVVMDLFTGMGSRLSIMDNGTGHSKNKFNQNVTGYNATGNFLLFGVKIGLLY